MQKEMLGANVIKSDQKDLRKRRVYEVLTPGECRRLKRLTTGHGNLAKCEDATGHNRVIIYRAIKGMRLYEQTAINLRNYINNNN